MGVEVCPMKEGMKPVHTRMFLAIEGIRPRVNMRGSPTSETI
jgi:hypothetical protein